MKLKLKIWPAIALALLIAVPCLHAYAGSLEEEILQYTNAYRKSKGKPPLKMYDLASVQAETHARNMAAQKTGFGHSGFEARIDKIRKREKAFVAAAAENVAYGQSSAKEVVDGWIKSARHRKNMLGNYNHIGVGVAKSRKGQLYFVQIFIRTDN
jgi:uncharacterized protein YkwD